MIHKRFILRQLTRSGGQPVLFIACVMLSIVSLIAIDGLRNGIQKSLLQDIKSLHGADILIQSSFPISPDILAGVKPLEETKTVASTPTYEFYSMVRTVTRPDSMLADVKIVGTEYPFYGTVRLSSGISFQQALKAGGVIVEQGLLDRLSLRVGDTLAVGDRDLVILDVVLSEPDRPVNFFSFGPRVFVSINDGESLHLMKPGSRVSYKLLLKVLSGGSPESIASILNRANPDNQVRIETARNAPSRIKKIFDNFFFFLMLIALFTLLLAGIGIRHTLLSFVHGKAQTIAVMRAIGASHTVIRNNFILLIFLMGGMGTFWGILSGYGLQQLLLLLLEPLFPKTLLIPLSAQSILKGLIMGTVVTALFAVGPLETLHTIRPGRVFRKERLPVSNSVERNLSFGVVFTIFFVFIFWEFKEISLGLKFIAFLGALILVSTALGYFLLWLLKRVQPSALIIRQALRGIFKPGSRPISLIITFSVSLGLIFSIVFVEKNLRTAYIQAYPEDAPNLFFIDIQPDQAAAFSTAIETPATLYPVIRARLVSVNGDRIVPTEEKPHQGDTLSRSFNLTYRDHLLEDESLIKGETLFKPDTQGLQVSVLDTVVGMKDMRIGDQLVFNIQGVPVEARISSIRTRSRESIKPYFYFVFPENSLLQKAPRTFFTAVRVPKETISKLQSRIISLFPNISGIDVTQTIAVFAKTAHRLGMVIHLLTALSIGAGFLILISSILAVRWDRIREAVYMKILGADRKFILLSCAVEHVIISGISALSAFFISQLASYLICRHLLAIPYHIYSLESLSLVAGTLIVIVGVGLIASIPVIQQKPIAFLSVENGG
jgi:putative ABC transport system permease protein